MQAYVPSNNLIARLRRRAAVDFYRKPMAFPHQRKIITFSFDDCPKTACTIGAEILEKNYALGTYYVSLGLQNTEDHQGRYFDADDIKKLHAQGHEIACHTFSHVDPAKTCPQHLAKDLQSNQVRARELLGDTANLENFAYPFGNLTPFTKRMLRPKYTTCRSVRPGINRGRIDLACLNAIEINEKTADNLCLTAIDDLTAKGGWLIFFTHDIRPNPSTYGCTPKNFQSVVDKACASGADILSVRDAVASLQRNEGAHS